MQQFIIPSGLGHGSATLPATRAHAYSLARRFGAVGLTALMTLGATGCEVRLETPPPTEPTPDAVEQVRRSAVADTIQIAELSNQLAASEVSAEVRAELERIAADSGAQVAALGGIYVSGLEELTGDDEALPDEPVAITEPASVPSLVSALNDAAARNFEAADADENGEMARLLAVIGVNQGLAAWRLAQATGPEPEDPLIRFFGTDDEVALAEALEAGTTGITVADFQAIVKSEDAARYAFEVTAARNADELRAALRWRARVHAARATAWAQLGLIAQTDQDPRLVAYQIPEGLSPAELVLYIETGLSNRWGALIAEAAPGARTWLIENLMASQLQVALWGGATGTFPGMPEIGDQFGGAPLLPDQPRIPYEWAAELPEEAPTSPIE